MPRSGHTPIRHMGIMVACFNEAGAIMPRSGYAHSDPIGILQDWLQ